MASAGVAGALIGLLFVAISVSAERLMAPGPDAQVHRIRAVAALTAFTNALSVSLFALIPEEAIGDTAITVGVLGLLFVAGALLSLIRIRETRWSTVRDGLFLVGMIVGFVIQIGEGVRLGAHPAEHDAVNDIATLVAAFFLIGIARSWELIGGPSVGFRHEVTELVRTGAAHSGLIPAPGGTENAGEPDAPASPGPADGDPPRSRRAARPPDRPTSGDNDERGRG